MKQYKWNACFSFLYSFVHSLNWLCILLLPCIFLLLNCGSEEKPVVACKWDPAKWYLYALICIALSLIWVDIISKMVMYVVIKNLLISYVVITELETALSSYNSYHNNQPTKQIWAVEENYWFELAFVEVLPPCTFGFHLFHGSEYSMQLRALTNTLSLFYLIICIINKILLLFFVSYRHKRVNYPTQKATSCSNNW